MLYVILTVIQLSVTMVVGLYFYRKLRSEKREEVTGRRESPREMEKLERMRRIRLTEPLAERVRPVSLDRKSVV